MKSMSGNSFGQKFRVTAFGESHGRAVGVIVDGVPAGLDLSENDIQRELNRRRPGVSKIVSPRAEIDKVEILSGIFQGKTLGTPITMVVQNIAFEDEPYEVIKNLPRPGHADLTYWLKYGYVDYRGGGRASGRETVARVAAGAIAKKILGHFGIEVLGHVVEVAGIRINVKKVNYDAIRKADENPIRCADPIAAEKMIQAIEKAKEEGDSVGGIVEVIALNVPAGLGEPVFDKLDGDIAKALMSIGSIKGVEIGTGFQLAKMRGSEANDQFIVDPKTGKIITSTNNAGGILGGISNGMPIVARAVVKPTSSIARPQSTVDIKIMKETKIEVKGKHDPCICPRVVPVCESMLALVLVDHMIRAGFINPTKFKESPLLKK